MLFGAEFAEDGYGGGCTDAVGAGFEEGADVGKGADASGGFNAGACAGYTAKKGYVGWGCAAGGKAGGGFEEISAGMDSDFGGAELFFDGEQAGFENDLKDCAVVMGDSGRGVDGVVDGLMVAAFKLADGEYHVDFARAQAGD